MIEDPTLNTRESLLEWVRREEVGVMTAVVFAALAGAANLLGGALVIARARRGLGALDGMIAFGAGFMLAVAILGMLPGALAVSGGPTAVVIGYLVVT